MSKKNLIAPKVLGALTISAVMIIGVYVLIIDLPKMNKEKPSIAENAAQDDKLNTAFTVDEKKESTNSNNTGTDSATNPNSSTTPTTPTNPSTPTTPTTPTYSYKNGSFTSSKSYSVPGNKTNTLTATITISNDTVVGISTSSVNDVKSQEYYDSFKSEISGAVVSKKISPLSIGTLGGASLTSSAFNSILDQIRNLSKK